MMHPGIWTGLYAEMPLYDAIETLYGCGWRAFEISTEHLYEIESAPDSLLEIEKTLSYIDRLGVCLPQAHAHLGANVAQADKGRREQDIAQLINHTIISAKLGAKSIVMHPGVNKKVSTAAGRKFVLGQNIEAFRRIADVAAEHGCKIAIENLTCRDATTAYELLDMLGEIDHPEIGITLDTSHANIAGLDIAASVKEFGTYLIATHISDNNGSGDQHLSPGWGTIDWPAVMNAFAEIGYDGLFNLEIPGERHPIPQLRKLKAKIAFDLAQSLIAMYT